MEPNKKLSHDAMDAFVAGVLYWCGDQFRHKPARPAEVAFSDEWERKQMVRELHWN